MTRRKVLLLFVLVVALFDPRLPVKSEDNPGSITITGLKDRYEENEPISFVVVKNTERRITFACAAEVLVNGKYILERWDISKNAYKVAVRTPRELVDSRAVVTWDIPKFMQAIRPEPGKKYRFRVDIFAPREEHIYSSPFEIAVAKK